MDRAAQKVSIAIILILVLVIGGILYSRRPGRDRNDAVADQIASSTLPGLDINSYSKGRETIETQVTEKIIEKGAAGLAYQPVVVKKYTARDLKISYLNASTTLKAYGLAVAGTLEPLSATRNNEIVLMLAALESKDQTLIEELRAAAGTRKQIVSSLAGLSVPSKAITAHLYLLNELEQSRALVSDLAVVLDNPAQAIESADLLRVQEVSVLKAVESLNAFLRESGIVFDSRETLIINF